MKTATRRLALLLGSFTVCLCVLEVSLRAFYPKYQYAAESEFDDSPDRIWARRKGARYERKHIDTGQPHVVYHNNLGLRHHRDMDADALRAATSIGFFGDSYTENLRLPGQYGFVEVLDYLLNRHAGEFNVLNLGVDGYGTDQAFLYYCEFEHASELEHVFYVFCANDIRNIYENHLYVADGDRGLVQIPAAASAWWVPVLSRLHTTYFLIEAARRVRPDEDAGAAGVSFQASHKRKEKRRERDERFHDERADSIQRALGRGEASSDLDSTARVFQSLLHRWRDRVEANGGKFHVVLLPRRKEHRARRLVPDDIDVIDLFEEFDARVEGYDYADWRFAGDAHWNEAGNQLAAVALHDALTELLGLPALSGENVARALYSYYWSFGEWMPGDAFARETAVSAEHARAVRERYGPARTQAR